MTIYFDNSATTKVRPEVVEEMLPYLSEYFGNPSSLHCVGRDSYKAVARARKQVAELVQASPTEILFSPCGTMSNNLALLGRARFVEANNGGRHLISTQIEHPSIMGPCKHLESQGWKVDYLGVDSEGFVNIEELKELLTQETSIVTVMMANNEIGAIQPLERIAEILQEHESKTKHGKEIFFHTDAVQAAGKIAIDVRSLPVHSLSLSGHKFHAPKGIGALFLRKGANLMPIAFGGGQERGLLPGTEGLANIVALGKASELASHCLKDNVSTLRAMQSFLLERLAGIPGVMVTGPRDLAYRLPGHASIAVENAEGEALVMQLDLRGVCVSSASACHTGIIEPSHVLRAMRVPQRMLKGSVRISLSCLNNMNECEKAIVEMESIFAKAASAGAALS